MPRAVDTDDAPLTQDFQMLLPTLPPIDDSPPSMHRDALELNSTTSNCVSIVVWAPPAVDPPAVDHDDPSASGFSSFLEDNIDGATSNVNEEAHSNEIAKAAFLSRKISFIRQGILANKDLFLIDPTSHPDIHDLI